MWIICLADDSHEMSRFIFFEKLYKVHLLQLRFVLYLKVKLGQNKKQIFKKMENKHNIYF